MENEIQTENEEAKEVINLIKKRAKAHFMQVYMNILTAQSSFLTTKKINKVWTFNYGDAGIGKTFHLKTLILGRNYDLPPFQKSEFASSFSPEAFQDKLCSEWCSNYVIVVPELDEFIGNEDKYILLLKNLYDGDISSTTKKEGTIRYFFDSVIITAANNIRNHKKYQPIYDRFLCIHWDGKSQYVIANREDKFEFTEEQFAKISDYISLVGSKVQDLNHITKKEYAILNKHFKKFIHQFDYKSNRLGNHYDTITKIHSVFLGEDEITEDSANFILRWFIDNYIKYKIFTKSYKYELHDKVINSLRNDLFLTHKENINRKALAKFLCRQNNYSYTHNHDRYITRLVGENILYKYKKGKKHYYGLIK